MKKIYVPMGFYIVLALFLGFFVFASYRTGDLITGMSMAALFGSIAFLIAYIVYAFKKVKVGILLFSFLLLLVVFLATTPFTKGGSLYLG